MKTRGRPTRAAVAREAKKRRSEAEPTKVNIAVLQRWIALAAIRLFDDATSEEMPCPTCGSKSWISNRAGVNDGLMGRAELECLNCGRTYGVSLVLDRVGGPR